MCDVSQGLARATSAWWRAARAVLAVLLVVACGSTTTDVRQGSHSPIVCRAPLTTCSGECVDLEQDPANCGGCGAACPKGDSCSAGVCSTTRCPGAQQNCGGLCVDTETNPLNCGACNVACSGAEQCVGGQCECPGATCEGTCVDLTRSNAHCGTCDVACAADEVCTAGQCVPRCTAPGTFCSGRCVDLQADPSNCGACGAACASTEQCTSGHCACLDDGMRVICGGACIDTWSNGEHCGACDRACPAGEACFSGRCRACSGSLFYCPSTSGDPLATCIAQAESVAKPAPLPAAVDAADDAPSATTTGPAPLPVDLACQCNHCLAELADCATDPSCGAAWACAVSHACENGCWDTMGVCNLNGGLAGGCWKFCAATTNTTQGVIRAEALLDCTRRSGCGI